MESFDYLKRIRASNKYEFALLTTYDFEVGFFESFILNSLINNGIKKVSVYADGEQLSAALGKVKDCYIGKRYMVNPVRINAAFHPKLFLLLGQNAAKLFISSANLTTSGFCINNEIVNEFVYDADHPENLKIISQTIAFFEKLNELSFGLDRDLFKEIQQLPYYGRSNINQSLFFLDSVDEPIFDQIQRIIQAAEQIDIAVPYYDNALFAVEELIKRFPGASINVWLQNGKSKFPMWRASDSRFTIIPYCKVSSDNDGSRYENDRFYHGKVFRFKNSDRSFIAYGSANCTKSALTLSYNTGGNIECDVMEVGSPEEFDGFFDGFIADATELVCEKLNDDAGVYPNIHFLYGQLLNSEAKLYFDYSNAPEDLRICLGDTILPFSIAQKQIEVTIATDQLATVPEVFPVSFISKEGIEEVNCWIIYKDYLELFRLPDETGGVFSFEIDSADDKYLQDRYALLSAYSLSVEDILRDAEVERHFQKNPAERDPENDDDDEGGIIDYTPPSIDIIRQHKIIGQIRYIEAIFRDNFSRWIISASHSAHAKQKSSAPSAIEETHHISPDQDQSFVRFVKAQFKKLMNPDYQAKVDPERFYSTLLVFFEIFDKYTIFSRKNPEDRLMTPLFVADAKSQLLLGISRMKVSEETANNLLVLKFLTIVINHILNSKDRDSRIDKANQGVLASIAQDEEFRTQGYMERVLQAIEMLSVRSVEANPMSEITYVDGLFGYKPLHRILELIRSDYGQNCHISFDKDQINVETTVDSISRFMTMREGSLRELNNYVKMQGMIKSFFVDVVLRGNSKGPNPAIRITYLVSNMPSTIVRQKIYRKNGKQEESVKPIKLAD